MLIQVLRNENRDTLAPLCCHRSLAELEMAGTNVNDVILTRWEGAVGDFASTDMLTATIAFWPSKQLLSQLAALPAPWIVADAENQPLAWRSPTGALPENAARIPVDEASFAIRYPWDLLKVPVEVLSEIMDSRIDGTVREGAHIDGILILGEGSVVLPGVYMEGVTVIGKNCKIGPNCYFRGNTSLGDNCHVGQAVEVKNSMLMNKVSAGHLSYIGDSIVGSFTNFGAGTITSNFRHDGKNHTSKVCGKLLDTGRRKFGSIIGENVHTGIHTSIYPGRKIWADQCTLPGDIVKHDLTGR